VFHPDGPTFVELAEQALSSTERGYDLLAPKFDYTPFRTPEAILRLVADHLRPAAPFGAGLDVCCGTGAGLRMLRPLCRERVVGIDFSRGMLAACRQKMADAPGTTHVELVRGNVLAMPFAPAFDLVVCFGAFGHILQHDEPRFVREVARVLRPGGRFVFVTAYLPPPWSGRYWLARLFNGAMRLRNRLLSPPFIMYYLTFLLPEAQTLLERQGLTVEVRELAPDGPWSAYRLVSATRPHEGC
jgi:ubiquinone/menaquinone biosynthesis C-methylase UbiE